MKKQKRCYIYTRVSTAIQVDGYSLDAQKDKLRKGNCYDSIAIETIKRLRFDKCFITSAFISADFDLSIQRTSAISFFNAVIDSSKQTIGLYPKEKIGFVRL